MFGIVRPSPPSTYSTSEFPGDSSRKSVRPLDASRRLGRRHVSELVALEQEVSTTRLSSPTAIFRGVVAVEEA